MKTRAQKEQTVVELKDKLTRAKSVVFADYRGMTMSQLSDLRTKLREQNAEFSITKNTLLEKALSDVIPAKEGVQSDQTIDGPTATLFAYDDEISPLKVLVKAFKDNSIGIVKGGYLGTQALDASKVTQLSTLPTKDELRGKTVGILVAPLQGIVGVLQANIRNLVYALDQVRISKGGE
jgi:large subunit ribosomal protein L10